MDDQPLVLIKAVIHYWLRETPPRRMEAGFLFSGLSTDTIRTRNINSDSFCIENL